jgi:Uma2 family endonuclease
VGWGRWYPGGVVASQPTPFLTPEQYLELDSRADRPNEYYDGVMYPIEATTVRHSRIHFNMSGLLYQALANSPCEGLGSAVRVKLPNKRYAYPDMIVVRGRTEMEDEKYDTVLNPTVVIEILSPSTADFDRGGKAEMYRAIPSLKEYVIIAQDRARVEWYSREREHRWILEELTGLAAILRRETVGVEVPLGKIYERVEFDPAESNLIPG